MLDGFTTTSGVLESCESIKMWTLGVTNLCMRLVITRKLLNQNQF